MMNELKKKRLKMTALISAVLTAAICAVMNFVLIPLIERTTEGMRCFDMSFGYGYEYAKRFTELLSDEGRHVYLAYQLPLDFVYPIVYCIFFISIIYLLLGRRSILFILPVTLSISDYTENVLTEIMLRSESLSVGLAAFASTVTVVKTVLMYACFIIIAILFIEWLVKHKKEKRINPET